MAISEKKMQIVIDNYFKSECDVNTSIRDAFEKGFRIGVQKTAHRPQGEWVEPQLVYTDAHKVTCTNCGGRVVIVGETNFCPNCGAIMESEKEYLDKTFPEHEGGEWFDITDMMTGESEE